MTGLVIRIPGIGNERLHGNTLSIGSLLYSWASARRARSNNPIYL